ncbi:hypothetical protein MBM_03102 [Drepanopeziza brunnea f. sp. 'multigermtubi' MB_m1]|uniref:Uncharacterized protein n=1 Tax=Marssonina brunnea f. sp. multigermtubi (strain MB_m1) TaxID=1072389 RepID=K1WMC7_MARBU|nr:uncharacterized protein MBM_03102 [Drepanopeziza brunnea f. sp. 'multigermtubi' MB_m1]EKD18860.1 hypothetical protein MBM_03102 [Drepanopeziza brunnea f. sp. 'multigermtubi' MB_m1]
MTSSTQKDFGLSEDAIRKITEDEVKRIQALLPFVNASNYLERAFKDYGIVIDSEKKQCFAEYNISSLFGYNIRCNIKSFGGFSDPKVTWDDFKSVVKKEYKAFDLARWKDSIGFLNDLSNKWIAREGAFKAELLQFTRQFNLTGLACLTNKDITDKQLNIYSGGTYPFLFHRASTTAASSITPFIDLNLRIEALTEQLAKLKVTFAKLIEMDKPEPAYIAILNRNASRPEDLRNLLVTLPKAFKAALKLKAKPFKTAKLYEGLGKVISSLRMDYEATRIKLLKGRDLLRNLTFGETIAFFAALFTFKRSSFEESNTSLSGGDLFCRVTGRFIGEAPYRKNLPPLLSFATSTYGRITGEADLT